MVFVIEKIHGTGRYELRVVLSPGEEAFKSLIEYRMVIRQVEKDLKGRVDDIMVIHLEDYE